MGRGRAGQGMFVVGGVGYDRLLVYGRVLDGRLWEMCSKVKQVFHQLR